MDLRRKEHLIKSLISLYRTSVTLRLERHQHLPNNRSTLRQNPLVQTQNHLKNTIVTYHSTQTKNHYQTLHHLAEIHHPHQTQCPEQHHQPLIMDQTVLSERSPNLREKGRKPKHSFRSANS